MQIKITAAIKTLVNAILGNTGKTDRLDTARRMSMDADFSPRRSSEAKAAVRRTGEAAGKKPFDPLDQPQRLVKPRPSASPTLPTSALSSYRRR